MKFYEPESDVYYLESNYWLTERSMIVNKGCSLLSLEQANSFHLDYFFKKGENDEKPTLNQNFSYFTLPYELGDDLENGLEAGDICMRISEDNLKGDIYIASTDRDKCCFIKCPTIDEGVIYQLGLTHINTPFIIFDDTYSFFLLVDFDLPLQIIGYKNNIVDSKYYIRDNVGIEGWYTVFNRYGSYKNMPAFLKNYYYFLLPKFIKQQLDDNT